MEENTPKVEVQGVPGAYDSNVQRPQDTPNANQESQNGLDEFLNFDTKPNGTTEEIETDQTKEEVVETTEEENVDVVFEVNGQKINACMSASMAQMLKESEEMRLQVIDKIMAEASSNPDQPITVTTADATSRDTSATESADSPTVNKEPCVVTTPTSNSQTNGQILGKRPLATVTAAADNRNLLKNKVVTRGSVGIIKPKIEPKFVSTSTLRPAVMQNKVGPYIGKSFVWDHKAIVALIECYKSVNDRVTAIGLTKVDVWNIVGKRMRVKGFQVTDQECKSKFSTLTITSNSFKSKRNSPTVGKNQPWEYHKTTDSALGDARLFYKTKPNPRAIPVITVEDDSNDASDGDVLHDDEDSADPAAKKIKLEEGSAIDKFRRTYLRVETEKLKEMKAARALQQEQCKLQRERNEILSNIAALLSNKK